MTDIDRQRLRLTAAHAPHTVSFLSHQPERDRRALAEVQRRAQHGISALDREIGVGREVEPGKLYGAFD
jgi:hypothetical protein